MIVDDSRSRAIIYNREHRSEGAIPAVPDINGVLLSGDREIATVRGGELVWRDDALLPLYLKRTGDLEGWLSSRAIDRHRPNSRLLKRVLRLTEANDAETALEVNAATVTDRYWFRPAGSALTYGDVRFKSNDFASLSLRGDPDGFSLPPSRTPELTNTGSYEKCWRNIDGVWWLYKNENGAEMFSEMFVSRLGERLGFPVARYEIDGGPASWPGSTRSKPRCGR